MAQYDAAVHHDDHGHKQTFLERWFFSTNHKDIGTLYLIFSFTMACIGAAFSGVIRTDDVKGPPWTTRWPTAANADRWSAVRSAT